MASDRQQAAEAAAKKPQENAAAAVTIEEEMAKLKDELKAFSDAQKKIIDATKTFKELNPEDLTSEQQAVLGELAREEAKQAAFFQEKLTDLSKLPLQDFGDGKLVSDMNEVYQEVQTGVGGALPEAGGNRRRGRNGGAGEGGGNRAEPRALAAEHAGQYEVVDGGAAGPAGHPDGGIAEAARRPRSATCSRRSRRWIRTRMIVSSSIMDSIGQGRGLGRGRRPDVEHEREGRDRKSELPNNMEISGRSGEGRNGKSDGEMVGNTAVGKGGNETPTRMTSTPFENGSVDDTVEGHEGRRDGRRQACRCGQDGLRGPMPPAVAAASCTMLADQQSKLRQQAESLALQLRKQRRPTGDLESAIAGDEAIGGRGAAARTALASCRVITRRSTRLQARARIVCGRSAEPRGGRPARARREAGHDRYAGRAGPGRLRGNDRRVFPFAERGAPTGRRAPIRRRCRRGNAGQAMKRAWLAVGTCGLLHDRRARPERTAAGSRGQRRFREGRSGASRQAAPLGAMDGLGVHWTDAPIMAGAPPHGKAIRMDTSLTEAGCGRELCQGGADAVGLSQAEDERDRGDLRRLALLRGDASRSGKDLPRDVRLFCGKGNGGEVLVARLCARERPEEAGLRGHGRLPEAGRAGSISAASFTRRNTRPMSPS